MWTLSPSAQRTRSGIRRSVCLSVIRICFCMVHVFKIDAELQKDFLKCVCGASLPQSGRLLKLPRFRKFPKFGINFKDAYRKCPSRVAKFFISR